MEDLKPYFNPSFLDIRGISEDDLRVLLRNNHLNAVARVAVGKDVAHGWFPEVHVVPWVAKWPTKRIYVLWYGEWQEDAQKAYDMAEAKAINILDRIGQNREATVIPPTASEGPLGRQIKRTKRLMDVRNEITRTERQLEEVRREFAVLLAECDEEERYRIVEAQQGPFIGGDTGPYGGLYLFDCPTCGEHRYSDALGKHQCYKCKKTCVVYCTELVPYDELKRGWLDMEEVKCS